ncbi:MAG: right-handed parallel beta-helix repeat-containing protein, partial [Gammaproteobacteria bacterium]
RAQSALSNGDSLYLRSGDYWRLGAPVRLDVSGSLQDPVVLGAYSVTSNGQVNHTVSGARPILDGGTTVPNRGLYAALVHVTGRYVHVQDIEIRNSGGGGLEYADTSDGVVRNVRVDRTFHHGILSNRSDDVAISNSEVSGDSYGWREYNAQWWGGGIAVAKGSGVSIRDCLVYEGYGEGISAFFGSNDIAIENNTVYAARAVGIYINATRDVRIRNNIVLGTSNPEFFRGSHGTTGPGISLDNEAYQFEISGGSVPLYKQTGDVTIQNNLIAGTRVGIAFFEELPGAVYENIQVLHNTVVDNTTQLRIGNQRHNGLTVANNIFMSLSSGTSDYDPDDRTSDGIAWLSNFWSDGYPVYDMIGDCDVVGGLELEKMSGWRDLRGFSDATWSDFSPATGASTIGAGSWVSVAGSSFDYNDVAFSNPPEIGALADESGSGRRPISPVLVSVH